MAPSAAVSGSDTTIVDERLPVRLATLARSVGATPIALEADALAARFAAGRLFVAGVGQLKRGKSTLLNALVGEPVLPVGVPPVTSAVTMLRYGPARLARITFADGQSQEVAVDALPAYVTEAGNPDNRRGVTTAEVFLPAAALRSGVCLVDTPGIGSVFLDNTSTTRRFVPHIDAALVVLGTDPPISAGELDLVSDIAREAGTMLFVMSKADRVSDADLQEARAFTERVLADRCGRRSSLLIVSPAERVSQQRPTRDWSRLEEWLTRLGSAERSSLLEMRCAHKVGQLGAELLLDIAEQRRILERPLHESARRVAALVAWTSRSTDALRDLSYRCTALLDEFSGTLERLRVQFLDRASAELTSTLDGAVSDTAAGGVRVRQHAVTAAYDLARQEVEAWSRRIEPAMDADFRCLAGRFATAANEFLASIAAVEPALRSLPPLEADCGLDDRRHFHFDGLMTLASPGVRRRLLHLVLPARAGRALARRDARRHLLRLLDTNSHRVTGDLRERALEARRHIEGDVRRRLETLHEAAIRGLDQARLARSQGESALEHAVAELQGAEIEVRRLIAEVEAGRQGKDLRRDRG
jgi:hypothetical protein